MNKTTLEHLQHLRQDIQQIEDRLALLRVAWVKGSPGMKRYIVSVAKVSKEELARLKVKLDKNAALDKQLTVRV